MLDIKIIRKNPELVRDSIKRRDLDVDFDRFLELDINIIEINQNLDKKRALKNKVSKEIPNISSNEEKETKINEMKSL